MSFTKLACIAVVSCGAIYSMSANAAPTRGTPPAGLTRPTLGTHPTPPVGLTRPAPGTRPTPPAGFTPPTPGTRPVRPSK